MLNFLLSFLISIYPPQMMAPDNSDYICGEKHLTAVIYNNLNGNAYKVKPNNEIDAGAFVVLAWGDLNLMLPRTFNNGESSFTDGRWWWGYSNKNEAKLKYRRTDGIVEEYQCK